MYKPKFNLSNDTPAAPAGARNVSWQCNTADPPDISASVPLLVGDSGSGGSAGLVPAPAAGDAAAGKVLKADGTWYVPGGLSNPMTTPGDLIVGGASGAPARLAAGASGYVLTSGGAGVAPSWQAASGGGAAHLWVGSGDPNGILADFAPHDMTDYSAPSPYAVTFSDMEAYGGVAHGWQVFAGVSTGEPYGWFSNTRPEWMEIDLGSTSAALGKYAVVCGDPSSLYFSPPTAWVLEGSPNNATWTTLDTQTAQTGWGLREKRMFTLSPAASMGYRYYRITVSDWVNDTLGYLNIHEMYLYSVASVFGFGVDGDAYIDKVAGLIYGPRTSGVWPLIPIGGGAGGLADPGANGIIKRTALDITAAATADVDYALPLTAGSGISITSHVITATGGGGGGGGASGSLVNITLNTLAGSNANWQNYSQWIRFSGMGMLQFPASWVVKMQFRAGSPVIGSMCIKRTLAGSTAVIDTTSVTIGGVTNPTLVSPGIVTTDPISIALDDAHDYYFMVYFANVSANASVSAGSGGNFSAASAVGDQTGVTTIPAGTANVALFYSMYVP